MKFIELKEKIESTVGIVLISVFGSYGTSDWIENKSDIDIAIVVGPQITYIETLDIEDYIMPILQKHFKYDDIHITFILYKDFASKYARMAVDSDNKVIIDDIKHFDFQHYVLKFARNNREFERTLKIDEQYAYFGGVIDESLL